MKILYLHFYATGIGLGGAARNVLELAPAIRRRYQAKVRALVNDGLLAEGLERNDVPVTLIPFSKVWTPVVLWELYKVISEFKPDIVHSHHRYLTFLVDLFFKKQIKLIHTQHVVSHDKKKFFRYGHRATAVSEAVGENLIKDYQVPANDVVTIPNAVLCPPAEAKKLEHLKHLYKQSDIDLLILCPGRLETQKGHSYLIEAVSLLPKELRKKIKILCAGEGPLKRELYHEVEMKHMTPQFIFLGFTKDMPELFELCDFVCLPSLWEGLPRVVLEAYGYGRPVLATDIAGTREVIRPGVTGALVPPRDAGALAEKITEWFQHPEKYRAMGPAAKKEFGRYDFSKMIAKYWEVYEQVLQEKTAVVP